MSNTTREINRITTTIISISVKLIVYALIILLLYEAVIRGFAFGHSVFYAEAVEEAPGRDVSVTVPKDESVSEAADLLAEKGLIKSEIAFLFQSKFYDYETMYPGNYTLNTSMTSKEILQTLGTKPSEESEGASRAAGSGSEGGVSAAKAAEAAKEQDEAGNEAGAVEAAAQAAEGENPEVQLDYDGIPMEGETAEGEGMAGQDSGSWYYGEDEDEGGWIEDAAEDITQ
ncbi:endolytic transglycosylase MltG [Lacrimispora sp. 210928-DFI.3.58]|uniref:endolytic transglycosylase MltG n=1 Tax=Lacrimispora sp. 210928-DFI.3.58 TaxID=2883214 RepID=UPI0015B6040C|nr:endolytic transglycosylase MltG [Lacrimispora sp. 210928-DFI.3.58]MCB7318633.1 endolytic transglycosylase MltG [Lacrimispora sp. 210928-DFI.3.58]